MALLVYHLILEVEHPVYEGSYRVTIIPQSCLEVTLSQGQTEERCIQQLEDVPNDEVNIDEFPQNYPFIYTSFNLYVPFSFITVIFYSLFI